MLKIQRSIMRVAERVLGLTGMPLPNEILERVQIGLEARAIRDWEFFDEGITPWTRECFSPAVAAEFSYVRVSPRGIASRKGDIVLVTSALVTFPAAGAVLPVRGNAAGIPDATVQPFPRDTRVSPFTLIPGVDIDTGAEAATSGTSVGVILSGQRIPLSYVMNVSVALVAPTFPNLTIWGAAVNTVLQAQLEGFYIPATR